MGWVESVGWTNGATLLLPLVVLHLNSWGLLAKSRNVVLCCDQ